MRVLILAESFYPLGGGVGTYGLALSRELVKRGIGVTVVTRRQRSDLRSLGSPRRGFLAAASISPWPRCWLISSAGVATST
jgi:hypothetical protein